MVGNQSHSSTCLSASRTDSSGTHHINTHTYNKTQSLKLFLMIDHLSNVSQSGPVLRRDNLLLVCGSGRAGGSWNSITWCRETCMWVSSHLFHMQVDMVKINTHNKLKPKLFPVTGLPSVAPPTVRPLPRPDVTPPPSTDVTLLYAQGQKIGALPLNGTRLDAARSKTLLTLHVRGWTDTDLNTYSVFIYRV